MICLGKFKYTIKKNWTQKFLKPNFCHYHGQGHIVKQVLGMQLYCAICCQSVMKEIWNVTGEIRGAWPEACNIATKKWTKKVLLQLPVTNDMMGSRREENGNNRGVSLTKIISSHFLHLSHIILILGIS